MALPLVGPLLDAAAVRGFARLLPCSGPGYDAETVYETVEGRGIRPVIPLRKTSAVKAGKANPPQCEHGTWTFGGSDAKRGASKWRCSFGECAPASVWIKASRLHTLIPRSTERFKSLYHQRGAVEREFGVLKHQWAMLPLRVRRLSQVQLHVDLTILARLADAAVRAKLAQSA